MPLKEKESDSEADLSLSVQLKTGHPISFLNLNVKTISFP